jgi:hypothetical protein
MRESLHRSDICIERRHRRSDTSLGMDPLAFDSRAWPTRTPTNCRTSCAATRCGLNPESGRNDCQRVHRVMIASRCPLPAARCPLPAARCQRARRHRYSCLRHESSTTRQLSARLLHGGAVNLVAKPVRTSEVVAVVVPVNGVRGRTPVFTAVQTRRSRLCGTTVNRHERDHDAWQCGGQGFESPQLHPSSIRLYSHREDGRRHLWCQRGHWSTSRCRRAPQRVAHPVAGIAAEARHDVAVVVRRGPHLGLADQPP